MNPTHPSRRAFSLIETLVVIGVMGILIGLLMNAVQAARGAAVRAACLNNLKQVALAAQHHHADRGAFPASYDSLYGRPGSSAWPITNWPIRLLPYLDQQPLWQQTEAAYRVTSNTNTVPPHVGLATVVKVYTCPADGRLSTPLTDARGYTAAYGSYQGVGGGVLRTGQGYDGAMRALVGVRLAEVSDGASQTLLFGERPPWGQLLGGTWYISMIDPPDLTEDPNWAGGPIDSMHVYQDLGFRNCRGPFKYGPGRLNNRCDTQHFWSLHTGGANFAFCDGSVRFLPYSAEPMMVALATRAGGEVIPD
ncbi:MAG: DUF1559 domain-containing protein [Gemmataceae bacterium]|nr:DUF1559 domain-containing protein [Gemmataceae bacterium]